MQCPNRSLREEFPYLRPEQINDEFKGACKHEIQIIGLIINKRTGRAIIPIPGIETTKMNLVVSLAVNALLELHQVDLSVVKTDGAQLREGMKDLS